jgi:hypothetical protein
MAALGIDVVVVIAFTLCYRHVARPPVLLGLLLYYGAIYGVLFTACSRFSRRHGTGSLTADYGLDLRWRDSYRGLGVLLLANIVTSIAIGAFAHQPRFQGSNTQALTHFRDSASIYAGLALVAIGAAPFFEELFFRGLLLRGLLGRTSVGVAVVIQASVFGLAHYDPYTGTHNVGVIVAVGATGLVLGWSAVYFHRLGPGMVAHGLRNLGAVLAVLST